VALRTQQILAHESGLTERVDPLAGAHFIETLTDRMEIEAEKIFQEIERRGGMVAAIEQGYPQLEIAKASYQFQKDIEERRYINVGVNDFVEKDQTPFPTLKIDPRVERDQIAEVRRYKESRDNGLVKLSLQAILAAAKDGSNLMPPLLEGVRKGVTLGEVVDTLKTEFGEWREPPIYW